MSPKMALDGSLTEIGFLRRGAAVAIGTFDGVHLGHQALLARCVEYAENHRVTSVALTFRTPPRAKIDSTRKVPFLTDLDTRLELIGKTGIDVVQPIDFDAEMRMTPAQDFIGILRERINLHSLILGQGARIGRDRRDAKQLQSLETECDIQVVEVPTETDEHGAISSSAIRRALGRGDVRLASRLLGRHFRRSGTVVQGTGMARDMDVPTANLSWDRAIIMPCPGIYATWARLSDGRTLPSTTYVGDNPTLGGQSGALEVHLLNFDGDLYGDPIEVDFIDFIRRDMKFENQAALQIQIQEDLRQVEAVFQSLASPKS